MFENNLIIYEQYTRGIKKYSQEVLSDCLANTLGIISLNI